MAPSLEQGATLKKARQGRSSARERRCVTGPQAISQEEGCDNMSERLDAKGSCQHARHHSLCEAPSAWPFYGLIG